MQDIPATLIPKFISSLGVKVEHNLQKALDWCDVANMLRIQLERQDSKWCRRNKHDY